jgi:response regulator RpfG family c-di-GMP phosphodiesterase
MSNPTPTPPKAPGEMTLRRILIVDDEEIVLVALRETLRREGYQVVTANSPVKAMELVGQDVFSVIISDFQMPGMTGLDFLSQAKQIQPDATRILITAVLSLDTVIEAINRGEIYRFIVKPWLREELLATVKNAVQRHDLITRNAVLQATTLAMNAELKALNRQLEERVAQEAAQSARLAELNDALGHNLQHSVQLCLRVMQTFYPTLGAQARRVFDICGAMADVLKLSAEDRQTLEISARLHDIGLVGVPRNLIRKWQNEPTTLTPAERTLIEHHPVLGEELVLSFVANLSQAGRVIRAHHERWDGRGYPDRLAGDAIPWLARILSVAIAFAESGAPVNVAAENVKLSAGFAYDPEAVRVFLRALPGASATRKEREVPLGELSTGMIVSRGIYTPTGLLLVPEGQQLNEAYIEKLRHHHQIHPLNQALMVYC